MRNLGFSDKALYVFAQSLICRPRSRNSSFIFGSHSVRILRERIQIFAAEILRLLLVGIVRGSGRFKFLGKLRVNGQAVLRIFHLVIGFLRGFQLLAVRGLDLRVRGERLDRLFRRLDERFALNERLHTFAVCLHLHVLVFREERPLVFGQRIVRLLRSRHVLFIGEAELRHHVLRSRELRQQRLHLLYRFFVLLERLFAGSQPLVFCFQAVLAGFVQLIVSFWWSKINSVFLRAMICLTRDKSCGSRFPCQLGCWI